MAVQQRTSSPNALPIPPTPHPVAFHEHMSFNKFHDADLIHPAWKLLQYFDIPMSSWTSDASFGNAWQTTRQPTEATVRVSGERLQEVCVMDQHDQHTQHALWHGHMHLPLEKEIVVVYDECIKKDERSENFHTMNERVARELIRAFQHSHSR